MLLSNKDIYRIEQFANVIGRTYISQQFIRCNNFNIKTAFDILIQMCISVLDCSIIFLGTIDWTKRRLNMFLDATITIQRLCRVTQHQFFKYNTNKQAVKQTDDNLLLFNAYFDLK